MTTDISEAGVAALATAFAAIGTGSGWAQTRKPPVYRERVHGEAPKTGTCLVIGNIFESYTRNNASPADYYVVASVQVRVDFDAATWNPPVDAGKWKHDIKKAIADHTLGGTVDDVSIVSIDIGLPGPDQAPRSRIRMELKIEFRSDEDNPALAIG